MENQFRHLMAGRSDAQLQTIVQEKHRYEVEAYLAAVEELERRQLATPELLQEKANALEELKTKPREEPHDRRSWKDVLALFRITREYFYTPVIIYLNVLVWIVMIITGVNAFEPSVESLIDWGGNLPALTLNGEPWRLLTSIFLHGGVIHLLLNMYALIQAGAILEIHFGKHRYAVVYVATGILASLSSSAFNENMVSVGASGAIFGLYGLLLSLLITKSLQVTAEERKNLLSSTLIFVIYNVGFGLTKAGIDNAAHVGGLASGFIIGFLYYPFISRRKKSTVVSLSITVAVVVAVWIAPLFVTNSYVRFNSMIESFASKEDQAMWMYGAEFPEAGTEEAARFHERLKTEGIDLWKENLDLLNGLNSMPANLQARVDLLKKYCQLRIVSCETMQLLTKNKTTEQTSHLEKINKQIDDVVHSLETLNH